MESSVDVGGRTLARYRPQGAIIREKSPARAAIKETRTYYRPDANVVCTSTGSTVWGDTSGGTDPKLSFSVTSGHPGDGCTRSKLISRNWSASLSTKPSNFLPNRSVPRRTSDAIQERWQRQVVTLYIRTHTYTHLGQVVSVEHCKILRETRPGDMSQRRIA